MRTSRFVIILLLAAAAPERARAMKVQATSSTQYLWYQDLLSGDTEQADVAEYLRLNLLSLDRRGNVDIRGYGRLVRQLTDSVEGRREIAQDLTGRLYYLFLDWRNVVDGHLDLKLGRTYVSAAALPGILDGIHLHARDLGPLGLGATAFGGHHVIFDNKTEVGEAGDALAGASLYVNTVKNTRAELSYAQKYRDEHFAQEMVAFDFSTTPFALVNLVSRLRYDLVSERWNEVLLGVNLFPVERLVVRGEYVRSAPSFDKDSFYRFFDVSNYQELGGTVEVRLAEGYRLSGRYAAEDFDSESKAHVWGAGLLARPVEALTLNVGYDRRSGFGSRLSGVRFDGAYRLGRSTFRAGIDYDDFRRADSREDTARRYWVGGDVQFTDVVGVSVRAQDAENFSFNHAYQGFVALNLNI